MTRYMVDINVVYVVQVDANSEAEAMALAKKQLPRNVRRRELLYDVTDLDQIDRWNQQLDKILGISLTENEGK